MIHRYRSGEAVLAGDRITYDGEAGEVELVVSGDDSTDWFVQEYGPDGGLMFLLPSFGRLFLPGADVEDWHEDLCLVGGAP
jgi:hypothetical protein